MHAFLHASTSPSPSAEFAPTTQLVTQCRFHLGICSVEEEGATIVCLSSFENGWLRWRPDVRCVGDACHTNFVSDGWMVQP